ncbi:hypothetical protein [Nocardia sp. NPDC052566]|uniref:terpene synthase family protein n=1 Tax=Nocardia sp. NPDC052566 TaxID=3364330 RepID=UPI0037CA5AE2
MNIAEYWGFSGRGVTIWCPFPSGKHPETDKVQVESTKWATRYGLCQGGEDSNALNLGGSMGLCLPFARFESLLAVACYSQWGFLWDSYLDDLAADPVALGLHVAEAVRVAREPCAAPVPDDKWLQSLRDCFRLMEGCFGPTDMYRQRAEGFAWYTGQMWKGMLQNRSQPPTVAEFLRMRLNKSGMVMAIPYTAAASGHSLTDEEYCDIAVQAFAEATVLSIVIANEVISLPKEIIVGNAKLNLVQIVARERGIGVAEAAGAVWELYERMVCFVRRRQKALLADPRLNVARLAVELPFWISGGLEFMIRSARYVGESVIGRDAMPRVTMVSEEPVFWSQRDHTAPPYPDIAWWWRTEQTAATAFR